MSEPSSGGIRTQTPSVFKWLLNERASLMGEIGELRRQQARLEPSIAGLLAKVEALDKTCALLNDRVQPAAGARGRPGLADTATAVPYRPSYWSS